MLVTIAHQSLEIWFLIPELLDSAVLTGSMALAIMLNLNGSSSLSWLKNCIGQATSSTAKPGKIITPSWVTGSVIFLDESMQADHFSFYVFYVTLRKRNDVG